MSGTTDPATEVYGLLKRIHVKGDSRGDQHLAKLFGVDAWSREFYEIIFSILDRLKLIEEVVSDLGLDDDHNLDFSNNIKAIRVVFSPTALQIPWNQSGGGISILGKGHHGTLLGIANSVRTRVSYPKLDADEIKDILASIDELLSWLVDLDQTEADFIRSALITGLKTFRTRLVHVEWMGWSYSIAGLHEVIAAYMALERQYPDPNAFPQAGAMALKMKPLLIQIWEKLGVTKDAVDRVDVIVRLYGLGRLAIDATKIVGYLTSS